MNRYCLILIVLCTWCLNACQEKTDGKYTAAAKEAFEDVWECYRIKEYGLFSEYFPNSHKPDLDYFDDGTHQAQESSFLWPMSGVFSSAVLLAKADPDTYRPYLDSMVTAMEEYYDTTRVPFAYQAYPARFDIVDRYYDDNGLVGIDYIDTYSVTRNPAHLEKAKQVFSFIISGWDDRFEGGVPWVEGKKDQKPACSNGKALVLALKLYEATEDIYYLEIGKRFYHWIWKYLRDPERNIIMNSWLTAGEGRAQFDPYTYNSGTMIQAGAALYRYTGDRKYLDQALMLCEGSAGFFFHYTEDGIPFTYNIPWFDVVLFRGYQDIWSITGETKYADILIKALDYAWENARDPHGLVCNDWTGKKNEMQKPKWLLDSSCIPEFLIRTAIIKGELNIK